MKTLWKIKKNSVILVHPRKDDKPHQLSNWVNKLTVKEVTYDQDEMEPHDDWDWLMYWRVFRLPDSSPFDLIAIPMCSLRQEIQPAEADARALQKKIDNIIPQKHEYTEYTDYTDSWIRQNTKWSKGAYEKCPDCEKDYRWDGIK